MIARKCVHIIPISNKEIAEIVVCAELHVEPLVVMTMFLLRYLVRG